MQRVSNGRSRPSDKGGVGAVSIIFFSALWASVRSKNKAGGAPLDPPLVSGRLQEVAAEEN